MRGAARLPFVDMLSIIMIKIMFSIAGRRDDLL
jgi:hypothetical protein